jgi:predicted DNA-binding transcriptional regulator YafY
MFTVAEKTIVHQLIRAAYEKHVLQITYVTPTPSEKFRTIEPYSLTQHDGTTMLRAYQLAPSEGWRLFNVSLIQTVHETEQIFMPRRPAMIQIGGETKHLGLAQSLDEEQLEYEKLVLNSIVDMNITKEEKEALAKFRRDYGLTWEEVRGVHYKIFADFLYAVTRDRLVTDEERTLLIDLNRCLQACGAGLIQ